jgi:hypothetical protein
MAEAEKTVRQSVSIPAGIARRVRTLAKTRKTSANRVLVDLIEAGLQSKEATYSSSSACLPIEGGSQCSCRPHRSGLQLRMLYSAYLRHGAA